MGFRPGAGGSARTGACAGVGGVRAALGAWLGGRHPFSSRRLMVLRLTPASRASALMFRLVGIGTTPVDTGFRRLDAMQCLYLQSSGHPNVTWFDNVHCAERASPCLS